MATQPPVINNVATELQAIEKRIGLFFDPAHLLLTGLLAVAIIFGVYHFVSRRADQADGRAAVAQAVAKQAADDAAVSAKTNAQFQAETTAQLAEMQQARAALQQQNTQLTQALRDSTAALKSAQATNVTRNPSERAARWQQLVPGATVSPVASGGYALDESSGLATLNALENLPIFTQKVDTLTKQLAISQQLDDSYAASLKKEQDAHKSDTDNDGKQLTAANKRADGIQADYDKLKADCRKSKFKLVAIAYAAGFATRKFLGF